jgi:hypothetical protein
LFLVVAVCAVAVIPIKMSKEEEHKKPSAAGEEDEEEEDLEKLQVTRGKKRKRVVALPVVVLDVGSHCYGRLQVDMSNVLYLAYFFIPFICTFHVGRNREDGSRSSTNQQGDGSLGATKERWRCCQSGRKEG